MSTGGTCWANRTGAAAAKASGGSDKCVELVHANVRSPHVLTLDRAQPPADAIDSTWTTASEIHNARRRRTNPEGTAAADDTHQRIAQAQRQGLPPATRQDTRTRLSRFDFPGEPSRREDGGRTPGGTPPGEGAGAEVERESEEGDWEAEEGADEKSGAEEEGEEVGGEDEQQAVAEQPAVHDEEEEEGDGQRTPRVVVPGHAHLSVSPVPPPNFDVALESAVVEDGLDALEEEEEEAHHAGFATPPEADTTLEWVVSASDCLGTGAVPLTQVGGRCFGALLALAPIPPLPSHTRCRPVGVRHSRRRLCAPSDQVELPTASVHPAPVVRSGSGSTRDVEARSTDDGGEGRGSPLVRGAGASP